MLDHPRHIQAESDRFAAVLSGCDPAGEVPTCPGWTVKDLLSHLVTVQTFWAVVIGDRLDKAVVAAYERDRPPLPDDPATLQILRGQATAGLLEALLRRDDVEWAWSWFDADQTDPAARRALLQDPAVAPAIEAWQRLTVALVGIGTLTPSPLLHSSGNAMDSIQQDRLRRLGAVGDVCLRFFDENGTLVDSDFNDQVLGIAPHQLRQVPRRVAVAGGSGKTSAIHAALTGGWVDVLITDLETARRLLGS